jgi:hypothetical protein
MTSRESVEYPSAGPGASKERTFRKGGTLVFSPTNETVFLKAYSLEAAGCDGDGPAFSIL